LKIKVVHWQVIFISLCILQIQHGWH